MIADGASLGERRALKVALTNPYCWPQVRRGSERLLHELSHYLADRGHDVTVISSATEACGEAYEGPVRRIVLPRRVPPVPESRVLNHAHLFALQVRDALRAERFDVVHALGYHDAFGALLARRGTPMRVVYHMVGVTLARMYRTRPLDMLMFRAAMRWADTVLSVSRFAQDQMARNHGRQSVLLPAPTNTAVLRAVAKPPADGRLRLLFAGDTTEPRKGLLLLARAFALVRAARPDAVLAVSGHTTEAIMNEVRAVLPGNCADGITFLGVGQVGDLPGLYAGATVFVLPSAWEAQGMVLVEALATGTPVVACDHGGVTDIVNDLHIGRLFAPGPIHRRIASDERALAAAILDAADLAKLPHTEAACRAHAQRFDWEALGPRYEAILHGSANAPCATTGDCAMADRQQEGAACGT